METLIVGAIIGLWLLLFVPMAIVPFLNTRRVPDSPAPVVRLGDRRRTSKRAA